MKDEPLTVQLAAIRLHLVELEQSIRWVRSCCHFLIGMAIAPVLLGLWRWFTN